MYFGLIICMKLLCIRSLVRRVSHYGPIFIRFICQIFCIWIIQSEYVDISSMHLTCGIICINITIFIAIFPLFFVILLTLSCFYMKSIKDLEEIRDIILIFMYKRGRLKLVVIKNNFYFIFKKSKSLITYFFKK